MLFGANTMTFYQRPILQAITALAKCGFDSIEIWADHAWDEHRGASAAAIKNQLTQHNLQATVHCPIMDINIASPNRGIRQESVRQILKTIDFAEQLNASIVTLHPGHKFSSREPFELHWSYQIESMQTIFAYAVGKSPLVAVENMDGDQERITVKNWTDLNGLFTDCALKTKAVTLDVTHLRETDAVLDFIAEAGSNIAHLHLSDGTLTQMHLPLGTGDLDLNKIARALLNTGYQGICSLECFIPNDEGLLQQELAKAKTLFQAPK